MKHEVVAEDTLSTAKRTHTIKLASYHELAEGLHARSDSIYLKSLDWLLSVESGLVDDLESLD